MKWGVFAGSAARTAKSTYLGLEDNERQNNADARAGNADERAKAAADREAAAEGRVVAEKEKTDKYYEDLARSSGVKVGRSAPAAAPTQTEDTGSDAQRMNLGGPKPEDLTPAEDERIEREAAAAVVKRPAIQVAQAPAADPVERARQLMARNPGELSYKNYLATQKRALDEQESAARIRQTESAIRINEGTARKQDWEMGQLKMQEATPRAVSSVARFGEAPDEAPLVDEGPNGLWNTTKQVVADLEKYYEAVDDGQDVKPRRENGALVVDFVDKKTKKVNSTQRYSNVGQLRQLTQQIGVMSDPEISKQYLMGSSNMKFIREQNEIAAATKKATDTAGLQKAERAAKSGQMMQKFTETLMDSENIVQNAPELMKMAQELQIYNPEAFTGKKKIGKRDADGNSVSGEEHYNTLAEQVRTALPPMVQEVTTAKGKKVSETIDEYTTRQAEAFLEEAGKVGVSPELKMKYANNLIMVDKWDKRLLPGFMQTLEKRAKEIADSKIKKAATPKSVGRGNAAVAPPTRFGVKPREAGPPQESTLDKIRRNISKPLGQYN